MYQPLQVSKCEKCGKLKAQPKELIGMKKMSLSPYISDLFTFLLSTVGIVVSLLYMLNVWFYFGEPKREGEYDRELADSIKAKLEKNDKFLNGVLKDYGISNIDNQRRDNITLLIGSILATASLLILANTVSERLAHPISIYALVSIGLYSLWLLFIHDTAKKLDNITYYRVKAIEKALTDYLGYEFGIHSYIFKETRKCCGKRAVLWLRGRRTFWGVIMLLLSIAWLWLAVT